MAKSQHTNTTQVRALLGVVSDDTLMYALRSYSDTVSAVRKSKSRFSQARRMSASSGRLYG
eukprot:4869727-Amphidinium_carterae.1